MPLVFEFLSPIFPKGKKKTPDLSMHNICWFDGVGQHNGTLCGDGGIIRIGENTFYRWTLNRGMGTNTRLELIGVSASLSLAHKLGIDQL